MIKYQTKGSSNFLLLGLIRSVVEKHNGQLKINGTDKAFTVSVPESNKAACFEELEKIMELAKPLARFPSFFYT
jgi:hypothetical protein